MKALQSQNKLSGKLAKWAILLSEFRYTIHHRAGTTIGNADGLSQCRQTKEAGEDGGVAQVWELSSRMLAGNDLGGEGLRVWEDPWEPPVESCIIEMNQMMDDLG